jgi:hypothetical protein
MAKKPHPVIIMLPYLVVAESLEYKKIKINPYDKAHVEKEDAKIQEHLKRLSPCFAYGNSQLVTQFSYAVTSVASREDSEQIRDSMRELVTIMRYDELSDERNGTSYSNFDYFLVEIVGDIDEDREYYIYTSVFEGRSEIILSPKDKFRPNNNVFPKVFILRKDKRVISHFVESHGLNLTEKDRELYLRAMEWFNKSHKADPEVEISERILAMATALEALFGSPKEQIVATLKSGLATLLGHRDKLDHWVDNFYDARSNISHGNKEPLPGYRSKGASRPHIGYLYMARTIFRDALNNILTIRENTLFDFLEEQLTANEVRISELKTLLHKYKTVSDLYKNKAFGIASDLSSSDDTGAIKTIVDVAKSFLHIGAKYLDELKKDDVSIALKNILEYDGKDYGELSIMYDKLHSAFTNIYFDNRVRKIEELSFETAIYHLVDYMSWRLMREAWNTRS